MIINSGLRIGSGIKVGPSPSDLYSFTTFTFTNAGISGRTGPSLANCLASYNTVTNPWLTNTAFFNVITSGYQLWTVPATGSYQIIAQGASGAAGQNGSRGVGARTTGTFSLTMSTKIIIGVGQIGTGAFTQCGSPYASGGGGGCSFVLTEDLAAIYMIAGGGGAASATNQNFTETDGQQNYNAAVYSNGDGQRGHNGTSIGGARGTGGGGGGTGSGGCVNAGAGGGGYSSNGTASADVGSSNGFSIRFGSALGGFGFNNANGGFGGGAGMSQYMGGGGGGYSGGGGGGIASCACSGLGAGGGGGSLNNGTSTTNLPGSGVGSNIAINGSVAITKL
jgi:hypothetical protein